jgi:hypothetical protein
MVKVKKGIGIKMLRDVNGVPFPDGSFSVPFATYISRLIKAGDLILVKDLRIKPKKGGKE